LSIFQYDPHAKGAEAYRLWADEYLRGRRRWGGGGRGARRRKPDAMAKLAVCAILLSETHGGPMAHIFRNRLGKLVEIPEVAATQAKNTFDELLDRVTTTGAIESLSSARSETLDALSTKFEGLLEQMQGPAARKGMEAAFNASPSALGRAAVVATPHEGGLKPGSPGAAASPGTLCPGGRRPKRTALESD
jgi:hypothetical protein